MSYLDVPRIHLSGQFFTDPSTVNNDPVHYNPDCITPSPWQEPNGQHRFQLRNCSVKSVVDSTGFLDNDLLLGAAVTTTDVPDSARIVDIDVYQQGVSTIYGMHLKIQLGDGTSIVGDMDPATLNSVWFNAVLPTRSWAPSDYVQDSFGGDMNACGIFQTIVRVDSSGWPQTQSGLLQQLRASTVQIDGKFLLSFKFVLDGFQNVPQDQNHRLGRITGTLGPVLPHEPLYNPGQRWLKARSFSTDDPWNWPSFNDCPFKVDKVRKKLVLDLANSICRESAGGGPVDLGILNAVVAAPSSPVTTLLGEVDYSAFSYDNNAQIVELDMTDSQISMLEEGTLSLLMSRVDTGPQAVLTESSDKLAYAVEIRPIRMEGTPGTTAATDVYVSLNGSPVAGKQLAVFIESVHGKTPGATVPPTNPGNTPQAKGAVKATISPTDASGFARVTITVVKDPGFRTPELDGQLYFIIVYDPSQPRPNWAKVAPQQDHLISCLVWSQYEVNVDPEWPEMQAMMAPYMKLYPSMRNQIDLTDFHTVMIFANNPPWGPVYKAPPYVNGNLELSAGAIPYYLTRPFEDPRYMPITRDLSPGKLLTYLHFMKKLQTQPLTNPPS